MDKISAISLISYDAEFLPESIKRYYNYVDEIVLGLDKDRITWSNNSFSFDENKLWKELKAIDGDNKISVIEEDFHKDQKPILNDNYERNLLKANCTNNLVLSIDADEYLVNAKNFFYDYMPLVTKHLKHNDVCMTWATLYKKIEDQVLIVSENNGHPCFREDQGVLTTKDSIYVYARWTNKSAAGANRLRSPLVAAHWTMARNEIDTKINNTGHSDEPNNKSIIDIWKSTTLENYTSMRDFKTSGLGTAQWPSLVCIPETQVEEYLKSYITEAYQ